MMPNEAIHRMSGQHVAYRFGFLGRPLIGDLDRSAALVGIALHP